MPTGRTEAINANPALLVETLRERFGARVGVAEGQVAGRVLSSEAQLALDDLLVEPAELCCPITLMLLAVAIISIQVTLNTFGAERTVFWRESRHYSVVAYTLGKNIAALPLSLAFPFFFLLFFYQLLRPYAPFQAFYFVLVLVHWAGEGLGQLVSLLLNSSRQLAGGVTALVVTAPAALPRMSLSSARW